MVRRIASVPIVLARFTLGSLLVLTKLVTLERMIGELDEPPV